MISKTHTQKLQKAKHVKSENILFIPCVSPWMLIYSDLFDENRQKTMD